MLYESIALPLSYVGVRWSSIANASGDKAVGGVGLGDFVGARWTGFVLGPAVVTVDLPRGAFGAATKSAFPVHAA
jgi:hypothetical protein